MLRFSSLEELRKAISPDVIIVDDDPPTPLKRKFKREASERKVLEDLFARNWSAFQGPPLEREYRFHPVRRWRFDFAHLPSKTAFEIQGGLYQAQSGHRSQEGVRRDYEKLNAAQELGWQVFQLTGRDIDNAAFLERLVALLHEGGEGQGGRGPDRLAP